MRGKRRLYEKQKSMLAARPPKDRELARLGIGCCILLTAGLILMTALTYRLGLRRAFLYYTVPAGAMLLDAEVVVTPSPAPTPTHKAHQISGETVRYPALEAAAYQAQQADNPTILIYHTHATEAYLNTPEEAYEESGKWRTKDEKRNVVAIGDRLATLLTEKGFCVLHDKTNHEPPKLSTAYSRSLVTMEAYKTQYPSIDIFIDVHRDAYGKGTQTAKDYLLVDGQETARVMFVVGTGKGATGSGFGQMPDFESNLALAETLTTRLNDTAPGLAREVRIKPGRYNQHVSSRCLLVEVGHNANTFSQAMAAVTLFADTLGETLYAGQKPPSISTLSVWAPGE